ncbi:glycosyltransferase family 2 protein [Natronosalvus halobius]|uniref:glycosyltransferase family 2 protein n=1 Tax=Natronosalvus halobius TaxID=2953746 RepID=UPI00209C8289|nr:glycosyltransferase [Natronosalvus halobius]USZ71828.1 glycosyltransferase [Natronosalvus halobius]
MTDERVVAAMAYERPNEAWAKRVGDVLDARFVLVLDAPEDPTAPEYADSTLVSRSRLGFGRARRTSMRLAAELGDPCLVTDGDGQYPPSALARIFDRLEETGADVVIPQRRARSVWMEVNGDRVDRLPFERLETLCAFEAAGPDATADLDPTFDCQPGAFGFRAEAVPDALPTDSGWLADWEITVRALESARYATVDVSTTAGPQEETVFEWDDQCAKFERIDDFLDRGVRAVYEDHRGRFDESQRDDLERAIAEAV